MMKKSEHSYDRSTTSQQYGRGIEKDMCYSITIMTSNAIS